MIVCPATWPKTDRWKHTCSAIRPDLGEPVRIDVTCADDECPYGCGARRP